MKKNYSLRRALAIAGTFLGLAVNAQTYCNQQATSTADDEIFNVTIGTLTNTSICGQTGGAGSIAFLYNNYTTLTPPNLMSGQVYTLSVTGGNCSFAYSGQIYVWIDYNQNGVLNDPGEMVWNMGGTFGTGLGTVYTNTILIPTTLSNFGITRMRVTLVEGSLASPASPCVNYTWGETEDYNVNIIANTPCAGTPATNSVLPVTYSTCPGLTNPSMVLATSYTVGGIQYAWYASTVSAVGPFTPVSGATLQTAPVPTLGTTTWYQAVVTCTNSNSSSTTSASQYFVDGQITSSVPYLETFENIQGPNRLPNCSWSATSINGVTQTYTASASNNRLPYQGSRFAAFSNATPGTNYFYTNGIQMEPGVTYSAGLMYTTEYFGYTNWTSLGVYVGTSQAAASMSLVAQTAPAVSGPYKELGGTFTIPTSGVYYVAVRAIGTAGSAPYLSWDNLTVNIPCTATSGNQPTVSLSASSTVACVGDAITFNATGADTYAWSTGATGASASDSPVSPSTYVYSVIGTNTLTGCTDTETVSVLVNPSPVVNAFASAPFVCPGETSYLSASGANQYAWNIGQTGAVISVNPNSTTSYSVIGTNLQGCTATGVVTVAVKPAPTIVASSSNLSSACIGDQVTLTANGGATYTWYSNTSAQLLGGNPVNVIMQSSTTFTVIGVGANGCSGKTTVTQAVDPCTSITENAGALSGISVYPNPTTSMFTVELKSGVMSSVVVTDVTGRVVMSANVNANKSEVNLDGFSSGVYYVKISSENNFSVVRVVKN